MITRKQASQLAAKLYGRDARVAHAAFIKTLPIRRVPSARKLTTALPRVKAISPGALTTSAYLESKNRGHETSTPVFLLFADRKPLVNCLTPKEAAHDSH
jgi:hypothetical protein